MDALFMLDAASQLHDDGYITGQLPMTEVMGLQLR